MGSTASPGHTALGEVVVNGRGRPLEDVTPRTTLLDWLRGLGLTGSKEGCAEGECGACAVLVLRPDRSGARAAEWTAVNACLVPAAAVDGQEILTVEGIGSTDALHPVQHELAVRGGSQCGYCTPGFVCSMTAEYYRHDRATGAGQEEDAGTGRRENGPNGFDLDALSGNLCRCTGYRPIRDAAFALGDPDERDVLGARLTRPAPAPRPIELERDGLRFVRPGSLAEALGILADEPSAVVAAGWTDLGVESNLRGVLAPVVVAVDHLEELRGLSVGPDEVRIGAALTLTELDRGLDGAVPLLAALIPRFASRLIRNRATLGGNLGTGSPIGDAAPVLLALDATLVLTSAAGERVVPVVDYFTGYRRSVRGPGEVIREIVLPVPSPRLTAFHKVAKREVDDISGVAVAYALDVLGGLVVRAAIGLGGVAATPLRAGAVEAMLVGRPWDAATVREAARLLGTAGSPLDDLRASARYRSEMLRQSLLRLHAENPDPEQVPR